MRSFAQKRFFKNTQIFKFLPDGVMQVKRRSLQQSCDWIVSLAQVNPVYRQVSVSSNLWLFMLLASLLGMCILMLDYRYDPKATIASVEFLKFFIFYFSGFLIALPFYLLRKIKYTVFHYEYEGEPAAFGFYSNNPDEISFNSFVKELQEHIHEARLSSKEREFAKAEVAIDYLVSEKVVNDSVGTILHYRLDDMNYFSND